LACFQKNDLLSIINKDAADLHVKIDRLCALVASILKQKTGENDHTMTFQGLHSPAEVRLKKVIAEAIEALEESRRAFKSKQLEALRKKLTQALIETR